MRDQATGGAAQPWRPTVGDWVTYRPHPGAAAEERRGWSNMIGDDMAFVRYHGDRTTKALSPRGEDARAVGGSRIQDQD